jgi:hypothetical protein
MDRQELHRQIDEILSEFEKGKQFGYVQVEFAAGRPELIRKMTTKKIQNEGTTRYEPRRETR